MSKRIRSFRLSERTSNQLKRLQDWFGVEDDTRVIEILAERAIARMEYQAEVKRGEDWRYCSICGEEYNALAGLHLCDESIRREVSQDGEKEGELC